MGGNRAAYASASSTRRRDTDGGGGVHSLRRGQPTRGVGTNNQEPYDSGGDAGDVDDDEGERDNRGVFDASSPTAKTNGFKGRTAGRQRHLRDNGDGNDEQEDDDNEYDDDDDDDDDDELAEREREALREREEMRQRFTFKEHKRRNLRSDIVSAMRRKRRMLMRNENLRFRELYKPPEPMVLFTVIAMVTIVSLILTKSWPFY